MEGKDRDYFLALYEVAKVVNASLEPDRVLGEIVRCVAEAMDVKACSLRLLNRKRDKLLWGAAWGLSDGYIRKGAVVVSESGLDRKSLAGDTIYIRDARTDADFQYGAKAAAEGIVSVLVVPLLVEKHAVGVLRVYSDRERKFDDEETRFMEAVANLSAIALENARLHKAIQTEYDYLVADKYRLDDN